MSHPPTFDALVADLTRDARRVQPKDALQFCANWFQSRLEEQRARARDVLSHHPVLAHAAGLPADHYFDTHTPHPSPYAPSFASVPPKQRPSLSMDNSASPFGTLNVPGNALLQDGYGTRSGRPTFRFESEDPSSPLSPASPPGGPFASFGGNSFPPQNDFLTEPSATILARRTSVSAESIAVDSDNHDPLPVYPKSPEQLQRIRASIAGHFLFRDLDEEQESGVLNAMRETQVKTDDVVIRQGDVGEYFYIVERGRLNIYKRPEPLPPNWSTGEPDAATPTETFLQPGYHPVFGKQVAESHEGSSFGELALMYGHPRAASVIAIEPCTLWSLDRITFRTIILKAAYRRRTMYEQFLASVPLLSTLEPEERSKIADALVSRVYNDGEAVVRQGDMGETFFFVEEGQAVVTKVLPGDNGQMVESRVSVLGKGDYFGELALLRLEPRAATVSAVARTESSQAKLKVAALDAHAFTRLLGPLREIMERNAGQAYGPASRR